jgi:hypothetical protein
MKTKYRYLEELGGVPVSGVLGDRAEKHKAGDVVGRASWKAPFLGVPGAKFFYGKRATETKREDAAKKRDEESSVRAFYFCFSSLAEPLAAARSGPGRAAFLARGQRTLDGEDRCEIIGGGGKDLFSRRPDLYNTGGTKDE